MLSLAGFLPPELILQGILRQNAYCQENSIEKYTGVEKRKYKLVGNCFPGIKVYIFFVLTSDKTTCSKSTFMEITEEDWENRKYGYLNGLGYLDAKKVEVLSPEEIIENIKSNLFYKVARLCDKKFLLIDELCRRAIIQTSTSDRKKEILTLATTVDIDDISIIEAKEFLDKYNI